MLRYGFLDRIKERITLWKTLDLNREVLVMIYGRRRMGKSELIKKVLTSSDIYHLSEEAQLQQQIDSFAKTVSFTLKGFNRHPLLLSQRHHWSYPHEWGGLIYIGFFSQYLWNRSIIIWNSFSLLPAMVTASSALQTKEMVLVSRWWWTVMCSPWDKGYRYRYASLPYRLSGGDTYWHRPHRWHLQYAESNAGA